MIDFEDVIKAIVNEEVEAEELVEPFIKLQEFLDNHLHRGKDFPPAIIMPYLTNP